MIAIVMTLVAGYFMLWAAAEAYNDYAGYPVFRPLTPATIAEHLCRWWRIFRAWLFWRRQP